MELCFNLSSSDIGDRFLFIDDIAYHFGASLKDLGKKCFEISKIEEDEVLIKLLNMIGG